MTLPNIASRQVIEACADLLKQLDLFFAVFSKVNSFERHVAWLCLLIEFFQCIGRNFVGKLIHNCFLSFRIAFWGSPAIFKDHIT